MALLRYFKALKAVGIEESTIYCDILILAMVLSSLNLETQIAILIARRSRSAKIFIRKNNPIYGIIITIAIVQS